MKLDDLVYFVVDQRQLAIATSITRATAVAVNVFRIGWIRGSHPGNLPHAFLPCDLRVGLAKGGQGREEGPLFGWINIGLDSYGDPDRLTIIHFAFKVHRARPPRDVYRIGQARELGQMPSRHWSTFPVATLSRGT